MTVARNSKRTLLVCTEIISTKLGNSVIKHSVIMLCASHHVTFIDCCQSFIHGRDCLHKHLQLVNKSLACLFNLPSFKAIVVLHFLITRLCPYIF